MEKARYWYDLGEKHRNLKNLDEAIKCYDKALSLDYNFRIARREKIKILWELKRFDEALEGLNTALKIDPYYRGAWINRGTILRELGNRKGALSCYDRALRLDPNSTNAWNNRGLVLDELGHPKEAIACYNRVLELDPYYKLALNNKGRALESLKQYRRALTCYNMALKIDPNYAIALKNKKKLLKIHKKTIILNEKPSIGMNRIESVSGNGGELNTKKTVKYISYIENEPHKHNSTIERAITKALWDSPEKHQLFNSKATTIDGDTTLKLSLLPAKRYYEVAISGSTVTKIPRVEGKHELIVDVNAPDKIISKIKRKKFNSVKKHLMNVNQAFNFEETADGLRLILKSNDCSILAQQTENIFHGLEEIIDSRINLT